MTTQAVIFPFELFGSAGAGRGAELLGDALREMLADNRREKQPSRARAYQGKLRLREVAFETLDELQGWRKLGRQIARQSLVREESLFWLTGNHLGVLPVLEELGPDWAVVQLDAHLDVYALTGCTSELSHGNFLLHSEVPLPPIVHVGHRDLFLPEQEIAKRFATCVSAVEIHLDPSAALRTIAAAVAGAGRIFLDVDCDAFDPAYFPAVQHPQPLGLPPRFLLSLIAALGPARVGGVAISEFDPVRDQADRSLATLLWLIEHLLLLRYERSALSDGPAGGV